MSISPKKKPSSIGPLSPEFALLGFLYQEPTHGYELHLRLKNELGQLWHASQSQIYNILKRLEKNQYINGQQRTQEGLPDRKVFQLTEDGRKYFETWLRTPSGSSVRSIRVEFITRMYFATSIDMHLATSIIKEQETEIKSGLARITRLYEYTPPDQVYNRLSLDLRIRHLESTLTWLEGHREIFIIEAVAG